MRRIAAEPVSRPVGVSEVRHRRSFDPMKPATRVWFPVARLQQLLTSRAAYIMALASLLVGGAMLSAPLASAYTSVPWCEPDPVTCYINDLVLGGIPQPKTKDDIKKFLAIGNAVCQDVRGGGIWEIDEVAILQKALLANGQKVTVDTAAALVTAATADLCWNGPMELPPTDPGFSTVEKRFLSDLSRFSKPPISPKALVTMGWRACKDIGHGVTYQEEKETLMVELVNRGNQTSLVDTGNVVSYALQDLCPNVPKR